MAVCYAESWMNLQTLDQLSPSAVIWSKYDQAASTQTLGGPSSVGAGANGHSYRMSVGESLVSQAPLPVVPSTTSFVKMLGFYIDTTGAPSGNGYFWGVLEGSTIHLRFGLTSTLQLQAYRNTTALGSPSTFTFSRGNRYWIEIKGNIHDSAGSFEVRVDLAVVYSGSSLDTRNGGTGQWDGEAYYGALVINKYVYFSDCAILDTSGADCNDYLGIQQTYNRLPKTDAAGAGTNAGFAPSTSTDHGALVDESIPNTTDYNTGSVATTKDSYQLTAPVFTGQLRAVQVDLYGLKTDAGAREIKSVVRSGGTDFNGPTQLPLTTASTLSSMFQNDPNTAAPWTNTNLSAAEIGAQVTV